MRSFYMLFDEYYNLLILPGDSMGFCLLYDYVIFQVLLISNFVHLLLTLLSNSCLKIDSVESK
jgi:hypothetical protein